ncbi:MAG: hypothetical protein M1829_005021 [Trizodia sp. TS-e1964]|nr:MAG: hypothetical protein M1829_005021 [Trizodia sp. TS-e1964]
MVARCRVGANLGKVSVLPLDLMCRARVICPDAYTSTEAPEDEPSTDAHGVVLAGGAHGNASRGYQNNNQLYSIHLPSTAKVAEHAEYSLSNHTACERGSVDGSLMGGFHIGAPVDICQHG